jgi:hypothetical protein
MVSNVFGTPIEPEDVKSTFVQETEGIVAVEFAGLNSRKARTP